MTSAEAARLQTRTRSRAPGAPRAVSCCEAPPCTTPPCTTPAAAPLVVRLLAVAALAAAVTLSIAAPALAQVSEEDPFQEVERPDVDSRFLQRRVDPSPTEPVAGMLPEEGTGRVVQTRAGELEWEFSFGADVYSMNNQDFRRLDESTELAIEYSDDRTTFGLLSARTGFRLRPLPELELRMMLGTDSAWGSGFIGRQGNDRNPEFISTFTVRELNVAYEVFRAGDVALSFRMGRQTFAIGGVPRDYILFDWLDAITANLEMGRGGRVRALLFDLYAGSDLPDTVYFIGYQADRTSPRGFRGQHNTFRTGLVYENNRLVDGLDLRAYYFFAKVGANCQGSYNTGTDMSYCGQLGNFPDNDYVQITGLRGSYTLRWNEQATSGARPSQAFLFGEFSQSFGIDRKEALVRDVRTVGSAFGAGVDVDIELPGARIDLLAEGYWFQGSRYASDGLQYEHGYVGFKGLRVGGLTAGALSGWRPSAFLGPFGIDNEPHEIVRSGGMWFLHAGVGFEVNRTSVMFDYYHYRDTSSSFVSDFPVPIDFQLPSGYPREEVDAQERLGRVLGNELNVRVMHRPVDIFAAYVEAGVLLPGAFYEIETPRLVGTAMAGDDRPFWAIRAGTAMNL